MENDNQNSESKEQLTQVPNRHLLGLVPMFILILIIVLRISWTLYKSFGQKTRSPQRRPMYVGTRARPSLGPTEPSIFVSPSNLPPPPKYECMAPPSYEEVVGIHYPNYQPQPITQPISTALANAVAHSSAQGNSSRSNEPTSNVPQVTRNDNTVTETVVTVPVPDRRTSVTA